MLNKISQYFRDNYVLLASDTIQGKLKIFLLYNKLVIKNIIGKIFTIKFKKQKFLGFTVTFDSFEAFFAQFTELFVYNVYFFESKKTKPFIVDGGGNIGMGAIYFSYLYPQAPIDVYEPDPQTFKTLQHNITSNGLNHVTCFNKAISDQEGTATFFSASQIGECTGNSLIKEDINFQEYDTYEVETIKLSDKYKNIDYLKIDIEGSEGAVFNQLDKESNLLKNTKQISLEYHYNNQKSDNKLSTILEVFEKNNFSYIVNHNIFQKIYISHRFFKKQQGVYILMIDAIKK